ncbi:MAG: hypothetical protein N4A72_18400 [Bacteroidales bacterium]|jgi:hypothetical protein|nr:hypothetical protein [Bacteroidales bacterium]
MKVFQSTNCDIEIIEEKKCLMQIWKGFSSADKFREAQNKTLELFAKHKCTNFICNTIDAGALKKEETDWASENVTPALAKMGLKQFNVIIPKSGFAQMAVDKVVKADKDGLVFKYYPTVQEAIDSL